MLALLARSAWLAFASKMERETRYRGEAGVPPEILRECSLVVAARPERGRRLCPRRAARPRERHDRAPVDGIVRLFLLGSLSFPLE